MKKFYLCLSLLIFVTCQLSLAQTSYKKEKIKLDKQHENRTDATVFLPSNYKTSRKKYPLILSLHGYKMSGYQLNRMVDFRDQVSHRGFVLLSPDGLINKKGFRYWNASEYCCDFDGRKTNDLAYLTNLINEAIKRYPIDPQRVTVFGYSNGGFMAHKMACVLPSVKAIISFAGVHQSNFVGCSNPNPLKVLQIHGTDDQTIYYHGTSKYPSAMESVKRWVDHNNCSNLTNSRKWKIPSSFFSNFNVTSTDWNECLRESKVSLWTVKDAPHYFVFKEPLIIDMLNWIGI